MVGDKGCGPRGWGSESGLCPTKGTVGAGPEEGELGLWGDVDGLLWAGLRGAEGGL